jgi:dipeptidyl aminopeptidase/acylaminoacyl peptidase
VSGIDSLLHQVAALADDVAAPDVAALRRGGDRRRRRTRASAVAAVATGVVAVLVAVAVVSGDGRNNAVPPPVTPVEWQGTVLVPNGSAVLAVDAAGERRTFLRGTAAEGIWQLAWDPTGRRIAFAQGDSVRTDTPASGWILTANADGTGRHRLARCPGTCDYPAGAWLAYSPDGRQLAFADPSGLYVLDSRTGRTDAVDLGPGTVRGVAWSPDGSRLAVGVGDAIRTLTPTGEQVQTIATGLAPTRLAWSPDGTRIVVSGRPAGVWVVTVTAPYRTVQVAAQKPSEGPGTASWSPDGTRLVYFSTPRRTTGGRGFVPEVHTVAPDGSDDRTVYAGPCCLINWGAPAWSPDGRTIAVLLDLEEPSAGPHGLVLIDPVARTSREVHLPFVYGDPVWYPGG